MEEDVKRSKDAGFELHLTKPVHFSSLSLAIHALFVQSSQEQEQKPKEGREDAGQLAP
jgi:DNA-binding response OmpR family regulator